VGFPDTPPLPTRRRAWGVAAVANRDGTETNGTLSDLSTLTGEHVPPNHREYEMKRTMRTLLSGVVAGAITLGAGVETGGYTCAGI
jgi:hypothetical protein